MEISFIVLNRDITQAVCTIILILAVVGLSRVVTGYVALVADIKSKLKNQQKQTPKAKPKVVKTSTLEDKKAA